MKKNQTAPGNDDLDVPSWMLTFSDCMTLLLTFFVLLLSFSSFDDWTLGQLGGVFKREFGGTIFDGRGGDGNSMVPRRRPVVDWTKHGAEKPDTLKPERVRNPEHREPITDTDAYRDERILRISGGQMFLGDGCVLTHKGRQMLERIASFMRLVPCKAIISEIRPGLRTRAEPAGGDDSGLLRPWTVLQFLVYRQGLPASRFRLAGPWSAESGPSPDGPGIRIALLARDITE